MGPAIRSGDVLTVVPANVEQVRVGDVVLFESPWGTPLAHRLVRRCPGQGRSGFMTRGDTRPYPDPLVPATALLGRVVRIERHDLRIELTGRRAVLLGKLLVRCPFVASRWLPLLVRVRRRLFALFAASPRDAVGS